MSRWVLLLRGINVGGKNKLPMADLKSLLTEYDAHDIQTYIQSGNAVFSASGLKPQSFTKKLSKAISDSHGFAPEIIVLKATDFIRSIETCPFPKEEFSERILHFYFLTEPAYSPQEDKINELKIASEQWALVDDVFYLYAPDGFGRSKLAAKAEKLLGVGATVRNWRTVTKLQTLI
jgi:uncharacterized protein (DUF1697 family)